MFGHQAKRGQVKVGIRPALGSTSGQEDLLIIEPTFSPMARGQGLTILWGLDSLCPASSDLTGSCRLNDVWIRKKQTHLLFHFLLPSNPLGYSGKLLDSHVQAPGKEHSDLYL